jgi:TolA-binding protein
MAMIFTHPNCKGLSMFKYLAIFILFTFSSTIIRSQTVSVKFDSAMSAFHAQQYAQANRLFEEFFSDYKIVDEIYATAKYYSAESLLKLGRKDEAAIAFEYLVTNYFWSNYRDKSLYELGLIYFSKKKYEKCRLRFKLLLRDYPKSEFVGSSLYWIGESYSEENKLDEAIQFLEEAVADKRNIGFADYSIYTLANVYEKTGDYNNAVKYYDMLLTYHKNSKLANSAQIRIGICYFKLKDYQSSILELKNPTLNSLPENVYSESLYLLATSYYRVAEYSDAEKTYLEILSKFPTSIFIKDSKYGLAWTYFQQKKYNDAYSQFDELSNGEDSLAIQSLYWKAECKRYLGKNDQANNIYKQFLEKYPNDPLAKEVQYQIGVVYFDENNTDLASRYLLSANSSKDDNVRAKAFTLLGEMELKKGNYKAAKNYFEIVKELTKIDKDVKSRSLIGLGIALSNLNDYKTAIKYLVEIDKIDPAFEQQKKNFFIAENYFALGDFKNAVTSYNQATGDDKDLISQTLYGKAYSYFNLGDYENSAYQFADFIKKYPNNKRINDAKLRLADSYFGSKNYSAASRVYQELFSSDSRLSTDPYARYQYAQALYKSGKFDDAIKEFSAIQEKFPNSEYADVSLYTIGWIYFQKSNFREAISRYKIVSTKYPKTSLEPIIDYSIGDAYFNMGKYDSAIVNYEKVISEFPASNYVFDAVNGIQSSYVAMGDPEKAISFLGEFASKNPNISYSDQLLFKRGEIYYSLGKYEAAKKAFNEFISTYPNSKLVPDAYYWIGKSSQSLGQSEEALSNFNKVFSNYKDSELAASSVLEMGGILRSDKKYEDAIKIYDNSASVLNKSPKLPEILFNKGQTLLEMNIFQDAYSVFIEVATNYPESIFADKSNFELALIEMAAKRYANADSYLSSLSENRNDDIGAKAQYYYGLSLFEQSKYNDAITELVRVRTVFSNYDEWVTKSYLLLGDCYVKLGDKRNAAEMYRAVLAKHGGTSFGDEATRKLRKIQ